MREWERVIPEFDRHLYDSIGLGVPQEFGKRPALLIIDVVKGFTGDEPLPIYEAMEEYHQCCGEVAWEALPKIRTLIDACRSARIPIVYVKGDPNFKIFCGGSTKTEHDPEKIAKCHAPDGIPEIIAPLEGEFVMPKTKGSAFFCTPLVPYLQKHQVDSLIVVGVSTSGCVRAAVFDGYSNNFPVFVVEECVFDRSPFMHLVSLFDMNSKYADVITLETALNYLKSIEEEKAKEG